jgi:hypothetical protein
MKINMPEPNMTPKDPERPSLSKMYALQAACSIRAKNSRITLQETNHGRGDDN